MDRPVLYIHGFASSGRSAKAADLKGRFPEVYAPTLSHIPELAVETLEQFIAALRPRRPLLVGSSLGGYYALHLSGATGLPAVLVNPVTAIEPPLTQVVGLQHSYFDGSGFEFTAEHVKSLQALAPEAADPARLLVLVQLGDEVIDQAATLERLAGARTVVEAGGDHAFRSFAERLPEVEAFAVEFD